MKGYEMDKPSDSKLTFIKVARVLTYLAYAYAVIATVFLILGFLLLLLGASTSSGFVRFVYHIAAQFLQPFREIFPGQQISDRSYFSAAGLFAIIMYGIGAMLIHSLITFLSVKEAKHQEELQEIQAHSATTQRRHTDQYDAPARPTRTSVPKVRVS